MKPYLLQTLKEIALLGGIRNKVELSSFELSKKLESSQQTASRYLLELDKKGYITRELGIKKQLIQITENGETLLQGEYSSYQRIFDFTNKVFLKGKVVSGLGEGRYYTEQEGYVSQFKNKLDFVPYPGTLNVEIEYVEKNKLRLLKNHDAIEISEFKTNDRTFGCVKSFFAEINDSKGAIVLPLRSHYSNVLEFISPIFLRKKLGLKDGDIVDIVIHLD
jgi:riboflavin kinase